MDDENIIKRAKLKFRSRIQERYLANLKFDASLFSSSELLALERTAKYFEDYSTQEIEDEAHRDIPWLLSRPEAGKKRGGYIDYELALYRHKSLPSEEDEKETEALAKSRKFRELVDRAVHEIET